jgi:hypothetical protein
MRGAGGEGRRWRWGGADMGLFRQERPTGWTLVGYRALGPAADPPSGRRLSWTAGVRSHQVKWFEIIAGIHSPYWGYR